MQPARKSSAAFRPIDRDDRDPASPTDDGVVVERIGSALRLTLARPEQLNALTPPMVAALDRALADAETDPGLTAVVIGAQGRAFCAGADLKAARARSAQAAGADAASAEFIEAVQALLARIAAFPAPVIAAVQGLTVAGGLELALACDLIVATERARFADGHANWGLLPGGGGSARLPRRVGAARAKWLMFTGESIPAEQMVRWGGVDRLVADGELEAAVAALLESLAAKSPLGLRRMKRLVDAGLQEPLEDALARERREAIEHFASHDRREGLAAFAEKRAPVFLGR